MGKRVTPFFGKEKYGKRGGFRYAWHPEAQEVSKKDMGTGREPRSRQIHHSTVNSVQ